MTSASYENVKVISGKSPGKRKDGAPGPVDSCTIVTDFPLNASEVLRCLIRAGLLKSESKVTP